jgi:hypothetical protein
MKQQFSKTIEALLTGKVICETLDEALFHYLSKSENRQSINAFLHRIERTLLHTKDGYGYYCAYQDLDNPQNRTAIRRHFEDVIINMEGLVLWLRLARSVSRESRPLMARDLLKEADLLNAIEESSALQLQLDDVAHKLKVTRKANKPKQRLRFVLDYLSKNEYLTSVASGGSIYRATAKWSLLYDQLDYIQQHEGIEKSPVSVQQGEIL